MKGSCRTCNSVFIGEEEEGGEGEGEDGEKSSSAVPWVRTVAPGVDLPCKNRRDGQGSRLANGAGHHKEDSHESKRGPQDGLLERTRYTSLKDLLPLPLPSPTARSHGKEITIRNRLVKLAAYAYLQPAGASSPRSSSRSRGCLQWLRWEAEGCLGFLGARIIPAVRRTFGRLLAGLRRRTARGR